MSIISKLFKNKKERLTPYSIGNYEIRHFKDGTYAVYNTKSECFVGRNLRDNTWFSLENVKNFCKVRGLDEAINILHGVADKGEPLK